MFYYSVNIRFKPFVNVQNLLSVFLIFHVIYTMLQAYPGQREKIIGVGVFYSFFLVMSGVRVRERWVYV